MSMKLISVTENVYTFENENGETFRFPWADVRSMASALLVEYLKQDVSDTVDELVAENEIDPSKLTEMTLDQFKADVIDLLSYETINDLAEPNMDCIYNVCRDRARDLNIM